MNGLFCGKSIQIPNLMSKRPRSNSDQILTLQEQTTGRRLERLRHTVANRQRGLMVVMEDVHNPHNLAAIARSCDAFGVQQVVYTFETAEAFDVQQVGRITSTSASKWLDYRTFEEGVAACFTALKTEGWHIVATVAGDDIPSLYDVDWTDTRYDQLAVLVGNEHAGISATAHTHADSHITIPMAGMIQSFNVSVATAITLAEITRQRRASDRDYSLPPDDADALYADLLNRAYFDRVKHKLKRNKPWPPRKKR